MSGNVITSLSNHEIAFMLASMGLSTDTPPQTRVAVVGQLTVSEQAIWRKRAAAFRVILEREENTIFALKPAFGLSSALQPTALELQTETLAIAAYESFQRANEELTTKQAPPWHRLEESTKAEWRDLAHRLARGERR